MLKKLNIILLLEAVLLGAACTPVATRLVLSSPDGTISVVLDMEDRLQYALLVQGDTVVAPSAIALRLDDGKTLGEQVRPVRIRTGQDSVDLEAPFYRQSRIRSRWNQALIDFSGDWSLEFRVSDEGAAWRLVTDLPEQEVGVLDEVAEFRFSGDPAAWLSYSRGKDPYANAFQNTYVHQKISEFGTESPLAMLPVVVEVTDSLKVLLAESDLRSYPGMFLEGMDKGYRGQFARLPDSTFIHSRRNQELVVSRQDLLARTEGKRTYPWRILGIARRDVDLIGNNLVYLLAEPSRVEDVSWIRPGLSAWEWWNACGLKRTWFQPGVNTETYKAYIDFAAEYGIPYVILDEGWSSKDSLMRVRPAVDLEEIVRHAGEKQVGVFLWAVANVLEDQMEEVFPHYAQMGVKGFKVDFFDRDDQPAVDRVYHIAEKAAVHHLMLDLHGIYKPTGLNRTFPNIVNFEGVFGLEEVKWSNPDMPAYDVTFPFLRMVQGPVDYTQGAFRNATREGFEINYYEPMSQGTRTHQVASYIVFDSPFAMLCDSPSLYRKDPECTRFISSLPTVCDTYQMLDGKIGEYVVTLREKDGRYYLGALTNWTGRTVNLPLTFLEEGKEYSLSCMKDADHSHRRPQKYLLEEQTVRSQDLLPIEMAPGGGYAAVLELKDK